MPKKKLTTDALMLAELRGLRKDLLLFLHLQLRQQKLDAEANKRFGFFSTSAKPTIGKDDPTQVLNNIGVPTWPDPLFDLDRQDGPETR